MEQLNNNKIQGENVSILKYKHLSHSERINIARLYSENKTFSYIAKHTSRDRRTISREIKRNSSKNLPSIANIRKNINFYKYNANKAQKIRDSRYLRPKNIKKFNFFITYCNKSITPQTSLEDLFWNFQKNHPEYSHCSLKTMYNWAHKNIIEFTWGQKVVKTPRQKSNKEPVEGKKSIHQRKIDFDFNMDDYTKDGHYEIDTIYDNDKKGGAVTFNHRQSKMMYSIQVPDRRASTCNKALRIIIENIGSENILSITSDNGVEFAYSKVIEQCFGLKWYYCDPYSSYQRGQNERLNRDIRKYIPKGQSIKKVSSSDYADIIMKINNKPRRQWSGLSAQEYMFASTKVIL